MSNLEEKVIESINKAKSNWDNPDCYLAHHEQATINKVLRAVKELFNRK